MRKEKSTPVEFLKKIKLNDWPAQQNQGKKIFVTIKYVKQFHTGRFILSISPPF